MDLKTMDITDRFNKTVEELLTAEKMVVSLYEAMNRYLKASRMPLVYEDANHNMLRLDYVNTNSKFYSEKKLVSKLNSAAERLEGEAQAKAEEDRLATIVRKIAREMLAEEAAKIAQLKVPEVPQEIVSIQGQKIKLNRIKE